MNGKTFGQTLRRLREQRGWTQRELARSVGVDHRQISRYEGGHVQPRLAMVRRLARALGCTTDELMKKRREASETPIRTVVQSLQGDL